RRDRSILFWKSMPVSDTTTVLAKAAIPLVVLPLFATAVAVAAHFVMLAISAAVLLATVADPGTLTTRLPLLQMDLALVYGVVVHALWFAPIYCWLLLVSAWARRATLLWAVLPFFAVYAVEMLAFGQSFTAYVLKYRFMGAMTEAFAANAMKGPITQLSQLDPV